MRKYLQKITIQQPGFTVLETLFALVIFSIALVTLMTIAGRGISSTSSSYQRMIANYLNQESIEAVRYVRDNNFITTPTVSWLAGLNTCTRTAPCEVIFLNGIRTPSIVNCPNSRCSFLYVDDGMYNTIPGSGNAVKTEYIRSIVVEPITPVPTTPLPIGVTPQPTEALVTSTITWTSKGINHRLDNQTVLHGWR